MIVSSLKEIFKRNVAIFSKEGFDAAAVYLAIYAFACAGTGVYLYFQKDTDSD